MPEATPVVVAVTAFAWLEENEQVITLRIFDVFSFGDQVTVITGTVEGEHSRIKNVEATVLLEGAPVGAINLTGERMPGPAVPREQCSVETKDSFDWDKEQIRAGNYTLRW